MIGSTGKGYTLILIELGLEARNLRVGLVDSFGSSFVEGWET